MPAGRPAIPNELKRQIGRTSTTTAGGRRLPDLDTITGLAPAVVTPDPPPDLGEAGLLLWNRAWNDAITWLSPVSDMLSVERACRLADAFEMARQDYFRTHNPQIGGLFVKISKDLGAALGELGFSPSSRTKLGVAEVKKISKLEELRQRREHRNSDRTMEGEVVG